MKKKTELYHHGILGMKWGIRRYQNEDGTYTDAGKKRYSVGRERVEIDWEEKRKRLPTLIPDNKNPLIEKIANSYKIGTRSVNSGAVDAKAKLFVMKTKIMQIR